MPPVRPAVTVNSKDLSLKIPQARVLRALLPDDPTDHWRRWPSYNRAMLATYSGFNPTTGTINRVLNGIPEGSSSGTPHPGLLERGLLTTFYLEDITEVQYRITEDGIKAIQLYLEHNKLPDPREKSKCTNDRYAD